MRTFLLVLAALFTLFSCRTPHSAISTPPASQKAATVAGQPEILFLHLKVWKQEKACGAEMQSQQRVVGTLHKDLRGVRAVAGQWLVSFLDDKKNVVVQVAILNPLEEHYEAVGDNGQLRSVEVKKQEADCFIRVQYDPRFSEVQIEQMVTAEQRTTLFSIKI